MPRRLLRALVAVGAGALLGAGCTAGPVSAGGSGTVQPGSTGAVSDPAGAAASGIPFRATAKATFDEPWAMTFLPDGRALVTQRGGQLLLVDPERGASRPVVGTPQVVVAGQGGLGDVILAPTHASDGGIYLSWVERGDGGTGAAVGRARLRTDGEPRLEGLEVIWRQTPKTSGDGHFGHRLLASPDGRQLFVTSGDRQKFDPAQDPGATLGKVLRLDLDGRPAAGNPLADRGGVTAEIWTMGHRNPLGIAADASGEIWVAEMGPQGGDEVNLLVPGRNYGWPKASNGSHYGGGEIPDHTPGDGFEPPKMWWNPSISPGSLMIYQGTLFPQWRGDAFVGALSGQALIRIDLDGREAVRGEQWPMGARIREVEQGPDGAIWLLEDGPGGRLVKLTPA
ncbi:MAG TPA: PQQ-dependent sugar dehydrogenase [Dermatophilaceae bacterium]|nr:PQQ-dependent sugar dehydrogenase [Dermatophilaceae bacterium]